MKTWNSIERKTAASDSQLDFLESAVPGEERILLATLKKEKDPELFAAGFLDLGRRLEEKNQPEAALEIYHYLANCESFPVGAHGVRPRRMAKCHEGARRAPLQEEVRARVTALGGHGPFARRAEFQLRSFVMQTADPAALAAFAVAVPAFRLGRLVTAGRFGEGVLAFGGGFATEILTLTLAGKATDQILGRNPDWSAATLGRELSSNAILLGAMKLAAVPGGWGPPLPKTFAGVVFAHHIQSLAGLRPATDFMSLLSESFTTFLQAQMGGELSRRIFGSGPAVSEWDLRSKNKSQPPAPWILKNFAWQTSSGSVLPANPSSQPVKPTPLFMASLGGKAGGRRSIPRRQPRDAIPILKSIASHPQGLAPQEAVKFLARWSLLYKEAGLKENAADLLLLARERASGAESEHHLAQAWIDLGKSQAKMGHWEGAQDTFAVARKLIRTMEIHTRLNKLLALAEAQAEHHDPAAPSTFLMAEEVLDEIADADRPSYRESMARRLAAKRELSWARKMVDLNPPGKKSYALSELAKGWVREYERTDKTDFLSFAHATFQEARLDLVLPANLQMHIADRYANLFRSAWEAGPYFREEAREYLGEFEDLVLNRMKDPNHRLTPGKTLIQFLAMTGQFDRASRVLNGFSWTSPDHRSEGVKNIALALAEGGHFAEFHAWLAREPMIPSHRFEALIKLADALEKTGPERERERKIILLQATKFIKENEFFNHRELRSTSLLFLAERLRKMPRLAAALREVERMIPSAIQAELGSWEEKLRLRSEYDLGRFQTSALPWLRKPAPLEFRKLSRAAHAKDFTGMRTIATLLGYRPDGFEYAAEHLVLLPRETQAWVQAWLYFGASLHPHPQETRDEIGKALADRVTANFHSTGPRSIRAHAALLQAMKRTAPNTLQRTLVSELRERFDPSMSSGQGNDTWSKNTWWLDRLRFDPSDRIAHLSLLWLARNGSAMSQVFVAEVMKAPRFPGKWKPGLERALARGKYAFDDKPVVWN